MSRTGSRWLGLCLALLVGCSSGDDDGHTALPSGSTIGPLVSGSGGYVAGAFVWTDYAYDDRGANIEAADGGDRTNSDTAGGDVRYPGELPINNAADLIQLQIFLDAGGEVVVRAVLETLVDPRLPVLAVAFDSDADPTTGAAELPGGAWPADGPLGIEGLLEISSQGSRWWTYDGSWAAGEFRAAAIDPQENLLAATIPPGSLPRGGWRVAAAVGIATDEGTWLEGAADVFDLAFVGDEPFVRWQDNRQADILAGVLDSGLAVAEVDYTLLASGATTLSDDLAPGFHTLLYRSELTLAEGVAFDDGESPIFLGPYQPYLIYIPEDLPVPSPLSVFLHGSDQNHLGAVFTQPGDFYIGTGRALSEDPHLIESLGFAGDGFDFPPHMLQAYPLARGGRLGYRGIAHQDVLDVLDDVMRRFDVDADRVILQGASMGGIGAYRLATLQPDKWSVALPLIGFQAADLLPLSINLRNVPVRQINGAADPLIAVAPADASAQRLDELGYDYRYWLLTDRGHEAGGFVYDCVFASAVDFVRQQHPAAVMFAVDSSLDEFDAASGLDLRFDSAYWLADIRARVESEIARVEAYSYALPSSRDGIVRIDRIVDNTVQGADLCGENPAIRTGDEWRERAVERVRIEQRAPENSLGLALFNVASLAVDLAGAGIDVTAPADFRITSYGPCTIALRGLHPGQLVAAEDAEYRADGGGVATVEIETAAYVLFQLRQQTPEAEEDRDGE